MLQALIGPVAGLLDKFVEDKDQKNALAHEIATMAERQAHESVMAQIEVNKAEAASASLFKGGWRPAVGWVCARWRCSIISFCSRCCCLGWRLPGLRYPRCLSLIWPR
jgi:hypothetical protein